MKRLILLVLFLLPACTIKDFTGRNDTAPTPVPVAVIKAKTVEYRVTGSPLTATITYSSSIEGQTRVTTDLPFDTRVQVKQDTFLYLSAVSDTDSSLIVVQIFVDGVLFREASSVTGTFISVQGNLVVQ